MIVLVRASSNILDWTTCPLEKGERDKGIQTQKKGKGLLLR
jgi:hypothetical protein